MGHFYCSNISELVVRQVYARGKVSIGDMVKHALKHKIEIRAAEGSYDDEDMVEQGVEELTLCHVDQGILAPVFASQEEHDLWFAYRNHEFDWESTEQHQRFLAIKIKFAPGAHRKYREKKIPHITYIEH